MYKLTKNLIKNTSKGFQKAYRSSLRGKKRPNATFAMSHGPTSQQVKELAKEGKRMVKIKSGWVIVQKTPKPKPRKGGGGRSW